MRRATAAVVLGATAVTAVALVAAARPAPDPPPPAPAPRPSSPRALGPKPAPATPPTTSATGAPSTPASGASSTPAPAAPSTPAPGAPRALAFQHGVCYAHAWRGGGDEGYGSATSAQTLARLRALGVDAISLTPFGFLPSTDAREIRLATSFAGAETDERLVVDTERAHALGMRVALKPHLWIRGGAWPGDLVFPDAAAFAAFFSSYRSFIRHYAELAARAHVDLLVVGTELKSTTTRDPAAFRALIGELRAIYPGAMTYAANWDEAESIAFWDALDYVGVQAYYPIATHPGPSLDELRAGWRSVAARLAALSRRAGRPILLTELGYRATTDAALAPATWPEADPRPRPDGAHQAACYRAAFEALRGAPWLAGIYLWKWFTDSRDESGPTDYSPAGKPAEAVVREFYGGRR